VGATCGCTPLASSCALVATINFATGQTRSNNAGVAQNVTGEKSVFADRPSGNTVHFILDINDYFQ
jgi:hypothetical protein